MSQNNQVKLLKGLRVQKFNGLKVLGKKMLAVPGNVASD
jgi:hypothetical protein